MKRKTTWAALGNLCLSHQFLRCHIVNGFRSLFHPEDLANDGDKKSADYHADAQSGAGGSVLITRNDTIPLTGEFAEDDDHPDGAE